MLGRASNKPPNSSIPPPKKTHQQDAVTTDAMAFIVRHCSGVVCVSLEGPELDRLKLPPMIVDNEVRRLIRCSLD